MGVQRGRCFKAVKLVKMDITEQFQLLHTCFLFTTTRHLLKCKPKCCYGYHNVNHRYFVSPTNNYNLVELLLHLNAFTTNATLAA